MEIKKILVSADVKAKVTSDGYNTCDYIVIHETDNTARGANAMAHANLQKNGNSRQASWHYQVDDKEVIQSFDDRTRCWHAANSFYNNNAIGIEICVNDGVDYKKAVANAIELVKYLRPKYKTVKDGVIQHNKASGKNCPRYLRSGEKGPTWQGFLESVYDGTPVSNVKKTPHPKPSGMKGDGVAIVPYPGKVLKVGSKGIDVRRIQNAVGVKDDGEFGEKTKKAVMAYQKAHNLAVDGVVGLDTWNMMF
ncbi:putative N-acetylmuramoyl-L-alanine amidase [Fictibacillus macauensis ZFHKF-1]|uniref:N-acetylmuramoyl-L-alanine amidase n=1 Tax=Fictibacillus macauensis ZFHKF-1 TaxID=1196324 RepID=I8J2C8_9BACL|nr:N-acetylmuramoyl-L-alanine amidase [Fictibacillus macauensis]EIT85896.1 putative N-acetylmuramoyl-L-alanine amidase [Fictibacillus macauensis ZFHKF-1]